MLLALTQWLAQDVRFFNVFNYITLRTVLATMTALLISFAAGPGVIRWLAAKKSTGDIQEAYDYWILGKGAVEIPPRWSVAKDVLGWWQE